MSTNVLNIPNSLTLLRMLLTPIIVYMLLDQRYQTAVLLMLIAGLTDMADGAIAKYCNQQTRIGAYLDPMADKLMIVSLSICLYYIEQMPLFVFLAMFFRDMIIVLGAIAYEMMTGKLQMQPTSLSKWTIAVQVVYIVVLMMDLLSTAFTAYLMPLAYLVFAMTCVSGLHYMVVWTQKAMSDEADTCK